MRQEKSGKGEAGLTRQEELDFFWPGKEEAERGRVTSYKYGRNVNTMEAEEQELFKQKDCWYENR